MTVSPASNELAGAARTISDIGSSNGSPHPLRECLMADAHSEGSNDNGAEGRQRSPPSRAAAMAGALPRAPECSQQPEARADSHQEVEVKRCLGGSSRDAQRRTDPLHALGTVAAEAEVGADPGAAVEAGTTAPEAAGFIDDPGACAPIAARATAGSPNGGGASDASGGTGIPAATSAPAAAAEGGSSAPAGVPRAGSSASAAGATSAGILRAEVPASVAAASSAAAAGADAPSSIAAAADPTTTARISVPPPVAVVSSALSASRSITSTA
nr:translation initiation factor IF-2-like [Setaria viridis]